MEWTNFVKNLHELRAACQASRAGRCTENSVEVFPLRESELRELPSDIEPTATLLDDGTVMIAFFMRPRTAIERMEMQALYARLMSEFEQEHPKPEQEQEPDNINNIKVIENENDID